MSKLGKFAAACAAVVLGFGVYGVAFGADKAWTGAVDSAWETEGNWDPAGVPGTDDAVTIGSGTVNVKDKLSVASLAIGANATVFFGSTGTSVTEAYMDYPEADTTRVFRVAGDLSVAGKLALGGRGRSTDLKDYVEISNLVVSVGGDFTLSGAAWVKVYAAPVPRDLYYDLKYDPKKEAEYATKCAQTFSNIWASATSVAIGGTLTVDDTAILYPENDPMTGAPVVFTAAAGVSVAEGAQVLSENLGWTWCEYKASAGAPADARYTQARPSANLKDKDKNQRSFFLLSPGKSTQGSYSTAASSYGGADRGYGSAYAPFLAGAPGDHYQKVSRGGGTICIRTPGDLTVNGRMSTKATWDGWGAPTAGSIWLMGRKMTFGDKALLSVAGGDNASGWNDISKGICGGRISLGIGLTDAEFGSLAGGATPTELELAYTDAIVATTVDVLGGKKDASARGQSGTATTVYGSLCDVSFAVSCVPFDLAGVKPACGNYNYERNSVQSFFAPERCPDPTDPEGVAYACVGYVVSNSTTQVKAGPERSFEMTMDDNPLHLYWLFGDRYFSTTVEVPEHVTVTVNGAGGSGTVAEWTLEGETATVLATVEDGYEFLGWEGDVSVAEAHQNPLVYTQDKPRRLKPIVRKSAAPTTVTWKGGTGSWNDPSQWDTESLPGPQDDVVIAAGDCTAQDIRVKSLTLDGGTLKVQQEVAVGALTVGANATLYFGSTGTSVTEAYMDYPAASPQRVFRVTGDMAVSGKLALGGRGRTVTLQSYVEIESLAVSVGGDLTIDKKATVKVYAAPLARSYSFNLKTTDTYAETFANMWAGATTVAVTGAMSVKDTAILYSENDPVTGVPVVFKSASFVLDEGAKVSADNLGWTWIEYGSTAADSRASQTRQSGSKFYFTLAPLGSTQTGWSAEVSSYGGADRGYGFAYAPFMPGTHGDNWNYLSRAGGSVVLWASGDLTVDGTVTATATCTGWGAPTGGGIWLIGRKTTFGAASKLDASGADWTGTGAGGCGGRISLGIGLSDAEVAGLAAGQAPEALGLTFADQLVAPSVTVQGGKKSEVPTYGQDGTATTVYGSLGDIALTVLGVPVGALGVEPAYGAYTYARNETATFTAPAWGADPAEPDGIAYVCDGYVVSNATEEVKSGPETSFSLKLTDSPLYVIWKWKTKSQGVVLTLDDNVTATVNGETLETSGTAFVAEGATATVEALPKSGYEFLFWEGEVEYGKAQQNPLVYTADVARRLKPVVRRIAEPMTATWRGGTGSWSDAAMWDTANVPGLGDDVVITSGVCTAVNWIRAKSLTLGGKSTKLQIAYTASDRLEEAGGEIAGDLAISGSARLDVAQRNFIRHGNLTVGGDLTLAGSAVFAIAAGPADGERFTMVKGGGFLSVGGTFAMKDTSTLIPNCESYTGLGVVVRAQKFVLGEKATVDAVALGWEQINTRVPNTIAPGVGSGYDSISASYGGKGHNGETRTYGNSLAPIHPGSPTGWWNDLNSPGGGNVRIHAGRMVVNGTINASAGPKKSIPGAAGGGVWLTASGRLTVGPAAKILAKGVAGGYESHGGGGRIALGSHLSDVQVAALAAGEPDVLPDNCAKVTVYEGTNTQFAVDFPGATASVDAGAKYEGGEGTVRYLKGLEPGLMLIMR